MTATEKRQLSPAQKAALAREAGAKGRTAQPMSRSRRVAAYIVPGPMIGPQRVVISDGTAAGLHASLTPRQRRRVTHKARGARRQAGRD